MPYRISSYVDGPEREYEFDYVIRHIRNKLEHHNITVKDIYIKNRSQDVRFDHSSSYETYYEYDSEWILQVDQDTAESLASSKDEISKLNDKVKHFSNACDKMSYKLTSLDLKTEHARKILEENQSLREQYNEFLTMMKLGGIDTSMFDVFDKEK